MFAGLLPFRNKVIHSRWSGEAVWIPLGDMDTGLEFENHTSHGSRGDFLFYPGGFSETEILFVYGSSRFASKMGQLAGNHFLTVEGAKIWKRSANSFSGMVRRTFCSNSCRSWPAVRDQLAATSCS